MSKDVDMTLRSFELKTVDADKGLFTLYFKGCPVPFPGDRVVWNNGQVLNVNGSRPLNGHAEFDHQCEVSL
jgi:hypothetical protein